MNIELATTRGTVPNRHTEMKPMKMSSISIASPNYGWHCKDWLRWSTFGLASISLFLISAIGYSMQMNFFVWHPFFMILGWVFCCSEALLSYKPITMFNPRSFNRKNQRYWHRIFQYGTLSCTVMGVVMILCNKYKHGWSIVPHTVHGWMGILLLLGTVVQGVVGQMKTNLLHESGVKMAKWHGNLGKAVYFGALIAIGFGCAVVIEGVLMWIILLVLCILVFFMILAFVFAESSVNASPTPNQYAPV